MLVIPCRVQDEVRVGDSVRIMVLEVADDHVRLGVTSPGRIPEYQEHVVYLSGDADEEADGQIEAGRELVGT